MSKPLGLDVVMKENAALEVKGTNTNKQVRKKLSNKNITNHDNYYEIQKSSTRKPVIIASENTTKALMLQRRVLPMKQEFSAFKKLKKRTNISAMDDEFPLESPSSMDTETFSQRKTNNSYLDVSSSPTAKVKSRASSVDVQKSVNEKMKSFDRMEVEFYRIINQMTMENSLENLESGNNGDDNDGVEVDDELDTINEMALLKIESSLSKDELLQQIELTSANLITETSESNIVVNDIVEVSIDEDSLSITSKEDITVDSEQFPEVSSAALVNPEIDINPEDGLRLPHEEIYKTIENNNSQLFGSTSTNMVPCQEESSCERSTCEQNVENTLSTTVSDCNTQKSLDVDRENDDDFNTSNNIIVKGNKANMSINKVDNCNNDDDNDVCGFGRAFTKETNTNKSIHHFCVTHPTDILAREEEIASRFFHTPGKYTTHTKNSLLQCEPATLSFLTSDQEQPCSQFVDEDDSRLSMLAEQIMNQLSADIEMKEKHFLKLQYVMNEIFENKNKYDFGSSHDSVTRTSKTSDSFKDEIEGRQISLNRFNLCSDRLFQHAAAPKLSLPPEAVTNELAPQYIGIDDMVHDIEEIDVMKQVNLRADIVEDKSTSEKRLLHKLVNRQYDSAMAILTTDRENGGDMVELGKVDEEEDDEVDDEEGRAEDDLHSSDSEGDGDNLADGDGVVNLDVSYRFESVLDARRKQNKQRPDSAQPPSAINKNNNKIPERPRSHPNFSLEKAESSYLQTDYNATMRETREMSEMLKRFKEKSAPQNRFGDFFNNRERLSRTQSLTSIQSYEALYVVDDFTKSTRRWKSENEVDCLARVLNIPSDSFELRERFWYKWIDEMFEDETNQHRGIEDTQSNISFFDDNVEFQSEGLPEENIRFKMVLEEIERLSAKILKSRSSKLLGFDLCRRGACYRRIGNIKRSLEDLNRAVELEPKLLDAYWHRHLVYLLKENTVKALEDLNHITTYNNDHGNAYRSRAEIYKQKGEVSSAISNYGQAIRIDPTNPELYYSRAELLEERGDTILAMEDYKSARSYDKGVTRGLWKIAIYHFESESWITCINEFTELLSQEPKNAKAYLYRGCANAKLFQYSHAIQDLSVSIHLDPNNFLAFYHRGCLLRKVLPKQALQDLSVSLMLNSSVENVSSYLHRAIVYSDLERYDEATCDFEAAVRLDHKLAPAQVNLGIIAMNADSIELAMNRFNSALRMDPTYIRAYLCRAEAYEKIGNITAAIKDYTRAIFLKPDVTQFRMTRGRLLLKRGDIELASFHIRQTAEMDSLKSALVSQQAAVETFLQNYDKAIEILEIARRSDSSPTLAVLLGKTLMKASNFWPAVAMLNEAIAMLTPWNPKMDWPKEAADVFYHVGMCHMQMKQYRNAFESFNLSLKVNPEFASAYFQRGLSKMKLGMAKGVHDFNRTLAIKPKFYEAYLGRAAYYGMKKRYAKAIMNCNEALKIKSNSVRALLYRGAIKFHIKAYKFAIRDLTEAIRIDSNCILAYFNRAVCHHERKHYFKALRDYSIVLISSSTFHMKALLNRGLLYYQINDTENALHDFQVALKTYPSNAEIHHSVGLCYHKLNRLEEAVDSFTRALRVQPFLTCALIARGNALIKSSNKKTAESHCMAKRDYIRAIHLNPYSLEARVNLAYCLQTEGHFMKAWNFFTRTLEMKPDHQAALGGRAMVNLQMSNTFGAFVDMNNAIAVGKTAALLTNRGAVNQALGHVVDAMNDYQAAIKLDRSYPLAYYNAANLYFLHRQFTQAITFYGKAIEWNTSDVRCYVNRGVAKSILKDHDGALKDFEIALKLAPRWSHIQYNRGNVCLAIGQLEEAEKSFTAAILLQPDDALLYKRRADVRGAQGRRVEAVDDYRQSIDIDMKSVSKSNKHLT